MRPVYTARDFAEAQAIKTRLEAEGVDAVVQGEYLSGVWGPIPITPSTSPSIWVSRDDDFERAMAFLEENSHSRER